MPSQKEKKEMKNLCLSIADAYTILRTPKEKPFAKCRYARASRSRKWDMRGGKTSASGIFFCVRVGNR